LANFKTTTAQGQQLKITEFLNDIGLKVIYFLILYSHKECCHFG